MSSWKLAVAALLLVGFVVQAAIAARRDSVTIDEYAHLPIGLQMLQTGHFGLDPVNPPLARMLYALPLLADPSPMPFREERRYWNLARRFMQHNAARYHEIFVRSRAVAIASAAALGLVTASWAAALYGSGAGLAALVLFSFSPTLLAHGHLVTLDAAGALGFTLALFAFWRFLERASLARAAAVGAAVGAAVLCKLSSLLVAPAILACAALHIGKDRGRTISAGRWCAALALMALAALLVVNLGYAFSGSGRPLAAARALPGGLLESFQAALPDLRLPVPQPLLEGLDQTTYRAEGALERHFYLLGELSTSTWVHYHVVAFAVKTPLPILVLSLLALGRWVAGRAPGRNVACLFVPVLVVFAANALSTLNLGVRHLLPVYPLLFVASAPLVSGPLSALARWRGVGRPPLSGVAVALALAWLVAGTLAVAPRHLQYFNELAGGWRNGHRVLIDSNLDWGQDLIRLREYMQGRGLERIGLAYFGRVDPGVYGVEFEPLDAETRGVVAISPSFLMGRPYLWFHQGRSMRVPPHAYAWLREEEPVDRVGALFIYERP